MENIYHRISTNRFREHPSFLSVEYVLDGIRNGLYNRNVTKIQYTYLV